MRIESRPVTGEAFAPYGDVFRRPTEQPLAETSAFSYWSDLARYEIEGEAEIGWCVVRSHDDPIEWFERHDRTPELLIPVDAPFILPVMREDGETFEAFQVDIGQAVVIAPGVWHSACLPVGARESSYFVIFRRGTPAEDVIKTDVEGFLVTEGISPPR